MRASLVFFLALSAAGCSRAQDAGCDLTYGTTTDRRAIQAAMETRDPAQVAAAIDRAKETRGAQVGCPELALTERLPADTARPAYADVREVWHRGLGRSIQTFEPACPSTGRGPAAAALGAYHARLAGEFDALPQLANFAVMQEAQQFTAARGARPGVPGVGVYGYYFDEGRSDACALGGIARQGVDFMCSRFPETCPRLKNGPFTGLRFGVRDHVRRDGDWIGDPGGAGYDMGWATVMMVEATLQQPVDGADRWLGSALLAGEWALRQPLVTNHNYTAKLVWLLAQLYAITGRTDFRDGLVERLEANILPGVLTDLDHDGIVDGTATAFADLVPTARRPGRMWDGHNALPWYHAMNAWAVVEAYVAFRDRGDNALAERYRPFALLMTDSLAAEFVEAGIPAGAGVAYQDVPFGLLLALWKIAQHEADPQPLWEEAAWAIWNAGVLQEADGPVAVSVPLYLLVLGETPYTPLPERARRLRSILKPSPR
ncbi:MAG: hypothetical protein AAGE01_25910 [Pseudomonadota bacterium]